MRLTQNFLKTFILWTLIAVSLVASLMLFIYAIQFPMYDRVRGDAFQYITIAGQFSSIGDAFSYIGERPYGYPFFLYIIKTITSPIDLNKWSVMIAIVQFLFHILACIIFYFLFLKQTFHRSGLPNFVALFVTVILLTYPALVTYTTIPLADTFSVDLFLIAISFYFICRHVNNKFLSILSAFMSGLLFGYTIMVRPPFLPAIFAFYIIYFVQAAMQWKIHRFECVKTIVMGIAILTPILPTVTHFYESRGIIGIQDETTTRTAVQATLQDGLSRVRVYWSRTFFSFAKAPGIKDPLLEKNYGSRCQVKSVNELASCLLSRPLAIPFYFGKKMIALFDTPHLQPYAVDRTPAWFTYIQRLFEIVAFCGFISLLVSCISRPFLQNKSVWIGAPFAVFTLTTIFILSLCHIEGRYGFPAIPLSVASLFLGFSGARQAGTKFFTLWISTITVSGILFVYQIHQWDLIIPN